MAIGFPRQLLTLFCRGVWIETKFEVELFCFDVLFINTFYIKKYILCCLNKIHQNYLGKSLYKLLTVQFEKIHIATNEKLN